MSFQILPNKKRNTCTLKFSFENDNIKTGITTMQVLEKKTRENGYFVDFDDENQKFYDENIQNFKQLRKKENVFFNKFANLAFDAMNIRHYNIPGIAEDIRIIYEREKFFDNINHDSPIKINYRLVKSKEEDFPGKILLEIANLDDLIKKYGQGIVLFVSQVFVDNMNKKIRKEEENLGKTSTPRYSIGSEIRKSCFDEKKQKHVFLETLEGDDYVIDSYLGKILSQTSDINEILELTHVVEQVKENIKQENNDLKI